MTALWQGLYAFGLVIVLSFWLKPMVSDSVWIGFASLLAIGVTLYGAVTRAWAISIAGQYFVVLSGWEFLAQLWDGSPGWYWALGPVATLAVLAWLAFRWKTALDNSNVEHAKLLGQVSYVYRWTALVLALIWIHEYIPARERCWFLVLLGAVLFVWRYWTDAQERMLFSAAFSAVGLWWLWLGTDQGPPFYLPNLLAVLAFLSQQQLARRLPDRFELAASSHHAMILAGGLSFWWLISRWTSLQTDGFYLTVSWTMVALVLFVAGLILRERMYRWMGLTVLGLAVGRVVLIDVWRLEQFNRILSFMAIGIVLLLLGFLYNKFQDKIREWL